MLLKKLRKLLVPAHGQPTETSDGSFLPMSTPAAQIEALACALNCSHDTRTQSSSAMTPTSFFQVRYGQNEKKKTGVAENHMSKI